MGLPHHKNGGEKKTGELTLRGESPIGDERRGGLQGKSEETQVINDCSNNRKTRKKLKKTKA